MVYKSPNDVTVKVLPDEQGLLTMLVPTTVRQAEPG